MKLPLADAMLQVATWLEDCDDLLSLKPNRDLPRPPFRIDEAWVVVRLAGAPWRSVKDWPSRDEQILAATADGRRMIWMPGLLKMAMDTQSPAHLRFPATHWMYVADLPSLPKGL